MKTPTRTLVTNRLCPAIATVALLLFGTNALLAQEQDTWTGSGTGNWNDPNDWSDALNAAPTAYDSLVFQNGNTANNNNYANGTAFDGITISSGGPFNLAGNSVLLSGNLSGISNGIVNSSGSLQTVSLNLNLDWGFHTFVGGTGTLALNGTMTRNGGSVAYFDPNVTSTSMANDGSGLISGLGGAGLTYSGTGTTSAFTGLATMTGTSVGPYTSWGSIVPSAAAIGATTPGAAVNVELTATAAGNYTLANGTNITYLNTVFLANASTATLVVGSAAGAQTIDVGAVSGIGGFYVPAGNTAQALTIGSGASTYLTAGPETGSATPGTIVFAINGTTNSNQAENNATITNNGSGGAVTVIKTGTGTMYSGSTLTNGYSGGTYILQGQFQGGQGGSFGTGPVYVASNATCYINNSATVANNFYLSSGSGAPDSVSVEGMGTAGALAIGGSSAYVFTGTMNLLGAPVTSAPGCRIGSASTPNMKITGQISGTGTLEFYTAHSGTLNLANPNTSGPNANNFQGGVLLDGPQGGHAVNADLQMGANNQIPSGPNAGNVTLMPAETTVYSRFDLNGTSQTINGLIGVYGQGNAASNQLANFASATAATLTVGANNNQINQFIGYAIDSAAAPLSIVKVGANTQTFYSQAYSFGYHGTTTVSNGTLALSSSASPVSSGIPNCPTINVVNPGVLDASGLASGGLILAASQTLAGTGAVNSSGGTVINGTIKPFYGQIGTLTISNTAQLTGGSTYVWDVNNATTGTAGSDPGWALLSVPTSVIQLTAGTTPGQQITIKVTSLTNGDVPGLAVFNPNINQSWMIASSTQPLSLYNSSASQFVVDTSSFSNGVGLATQFSVTNMIPSDQTGNNLYLVFNSVALITTNIVSQTNVTGSTVSFTVGASGSGLTYAWEENGNALANNGSSTGGATVTITTNGAGTSSTLTLAGLQGGDNSLIQVHVSSSNGGAGDSQANLFVITPPTSINETSSLNNQLPNTPGASGAAIVLEATAFGQDVPVGYQWYFDGQAIIGATGSTYTVPVSQADIGSYTVSSSDAAGGTTNTTPNVVSGPLTYVPNQMFFEPFNYIFQTHDGAFPWDAFTTTNLYNELTSVPVTWIPAIGGDMDCEFPNWNQHYAETPPGIYGIYPNNNWPWEGLSGSFSTNDTTIPGSDGIYTDTAHNSDVHLPFGTGGSISNGTVYCSFVVNMGSGGQILTPDYDYMAGFGYNNGDPTTVAGIRNAGIYLMTPGDDSYRLGVFKINTGVAAASLGTVLTNGVNGGWANNIILYRDTTLFVVCRITVNSSGGSSVAMWIDPPTNTFYASEANVPTPDVPDVDSSSAPDVASHASADYFYLKNTATIASRTFATLHIGTTWASVTPPAAPTLSVNNVKLSPCNPGTAIFTSQNAGNPVTQGYGWTFNNGSGPVALTDTTLSDGAIITGSSTSVLTVASLTGAEMGAYTVTGTNLDQNTFSNLTGSATGTLGFIQPPLNIAYTGTHVVLTWPTNQAQCFSLEYTPKLLPTNWTVINPPYSLDGTGTNYTVTVTPATQSVFYQLIASP